MTDVTIHTNPDPVITICGANNRMLVAIKQDGTLEYGPSYDPDLAARTFWEALSLHFPGRPRPVTYEGIEDIVRELAPFGANEHAKAYHRTVIRAVLAALAVKAKP